MSFTKEAVRTPTGIGEITIELIDAPQGYPPANTAFQGVNYRVLVKFSDGTVEARTGNLVPHLTQTQINQLLAFMATMRAKAVAEFIGT